MFKVIKVIIVTFKHLKILNFFSLDKNYAQLMAHKDSVARLLFMFSKGDSRSRDNHMLLFDVII